MANDWFYTQQGKASPPPAPPSAPQLNQPPHPGGPQPPAPVGQEGMAGGVAAAGIKGLFPYKPPAEQPADATKKPPGNLLDMSPLAVFLLSLVTLGIFGL